MTAQFNPYKPDDKVFTKVKGEDVEGIVRLIYNNEVQVRTPDGLLRWRTVDTVRSATATESAPSSGAATATPADPWTPSNPSEGEVSGASVPSTIAAGLADTSTSPESEATAVEAEPDTQVVPHTAAGTEMVEASQPKMVGGCGTADDVAEQRRKRRRR